MIWFYSTLKYLLSTAYSGPFKMKTILTATVKGITGVRKEVLPTREAGSPRLFGEGK